MEVINGARALGIDARLGSIEAGKLADLYVVRGSPLDDIKAARDIRIVFRDGVAYDPVELLQSAEGKIGPARMIMPLGSSRSGHYGENGSSPGFLAPGAREQPEYSDFAG